MSNHGIKTDFSVPATDSNVSSVDVKPNTDELIKEKIRSKELENDNKKSDIQLKQRYATHLFYLMIGQLIVMNIIFCGVGKGCLHYKNSELNLYISGTLLELFALIVIITKYLFKKNKKD